MVNTRVCGTLNSGSIPDGHPFIKVSLTRILVRETLYYKYEYRDTALL